MTEDKIHLPQQPESHLSENRITSSRHSDTSPDPADLDQPRLGRRESEPHSIEITYLYDILKTNFPKCRAMWNLHHYFHSELEKFDIQYDISFFKDFELPYTLSSYKAKEYNNRVPDLAINVFSTSTWRKDLLDNVDTSQAVKVPIYMVFPSYHVASKFYKPPFLRLYLLQPNGTYVQNELRKITFIEDEGGVIKIKNENAILDVGDRLPFRFGLLKRSQKHKGNNSLFRAVLIKPDSLEIFHTFAEIETTRANSEKERANSEKERADSQKEQADSQKERAEKAEEELKKLKKQLQKE